MDMSGRVVYENSFGKSTASIRISTENIRAGTYIYFIRCGTETSSAKTLEVL
jgi:hypothetical protein